MVDKMTQRNPSKFAIFLEWIFVCHFPFHEKKYKLPEFSYIQKGWLRYVGD